MTAPLGLALLDAIDERVAAGEKMLTAMGTVAAWDPNSPTDVAVTFDSSAVAVPCKVFNVQVIEGDRVGMVKIGRWWVVVGTFTKRWDQLLGGTQWTGGGNLVVGLVGTELVIMTSASMFVPSNSRIRVSAGIRLLDTGTPPNTYNFIIREGTTVGGTARGAFTWTSQNISFGYNYFFTGEYDTGSTPVVQAYCISVQRVGGSGQLTMIAGGGLHNTHLTATAIAPAGIIEERATP